MNRLLQAFANLPPATKIAVGLLAIAAVGGVVMLFGGALAIYVVLGGLLVVGVLLAGYQGVLAMLARRHAAPMERSITSNAAMTPLGITAPARRARLDDLRKNFETGVDKFRAAGKNLYALPWYLLVGEPGSGKTEAVRHCNVGFPPGLQDQLQGVGGTLNMNWWFTNHAVILDTAGRLLFEEVEPGTSGEWQEFLKLLRRNRPNCPVNGMLLAIPAESLIRDSADALEKKGGRIAQQLDSIQRALGVRFPVYVLITKCDLINGFREFFDEITDPALQHQVLGWSNPESLDTPFNPELVEEHLRTVQQRLAKRRAGLLQDPVNTADAKRARTDQVDALYAFPDAMMKISPRLRRYLEMIFVSGEWSTKPLFLRGIYFTSSMREGAALDQELVEAFGVPIESLPEGRVWERDRAFFLRDLFMSKVFREKGLVTKATSTSQQQRARNLMVYGAATVGLVAVGLFTWMGARALASTIVKPAEFWSAASAAYLSNTQEAQYGRNEQFLPIVSKARESDSDFKYRGDAGDDATPLAGLPIVPERRTRAGMAAELRERAAEPIAVPTVFRPVAAILGDNAGSLAGAQRLDAARVIFEGSVLRPLIDACKVNLRKDAAEGELSVEAKAAVDELARLERACVPGAGGVGGAGPPKQLLRLEPLMRYALRGNKDFTDKGAQTDLAMIDEAYRALYPGDAWPSESIRAMYRKVIPEGVERPVVVPDATAVATNPKPGPGPGAVQPKPEVSKPTTPAPSVTPVAGLKFPFAPFTSAEQELTPEGLASMREANAKKPDARLDAMLRALPTAAHPAQICTLTVLAREPASLGKEALGAAFVSIAAGSAPGKPVALAGAGALPEIKLTKLRAPGPAFELRFLASDGGSAAPVATLSVPSRWGGMYLVDHFHGQPTRSDDRRSWDVEADVTTAGGTRSIWLRLEFDAELPELPWHP